MGKVHPGAVLSPHFRDFLPPWMARQPWYRGNGIPSLTPVGYFRFEDPDGEVGVETHLVSDTTALYQVPMTYRGASLDQVPAADSALIATAEHSVLGTRWIYDGPADPVWRSAILRLARDGGASDPSTKRGAGPALARGRALITQDLTARTTTIELRRLLTPGEPAVESDTAGLVMGTWHPDGPGTASVTGCLAVLRKRHHGSSLRSDREHVPEDRRPEPDDRDYDEDLQRVRAAGDQPD